MPLFGLQPAGLIERIFEEVGVAVAVIDQHQKTVFANKTAYAMLKRSETDEPVSLEQWQRELALLDPRTHLPPQEAAVTRALRGEHVESQELEAKLPDGRTRWLLLWAYPFSVMGLAGVLVLIIDETAEVELRRAASQVDRMETLSVLVSGLTHDLNNILDTIALNAQGPSQLGDAPLNCHARLEQISLATRKAAELVRRLKQFSQTQHLQYRAVQLNDVIGEVLRLVHPLFRKAIVVKTALCERLPYVWADPTQLEQVLVNLIVNALDAMPEGGELRISTTVEKPAAAEGTKVDGKQVCVIVADSGVGIPEDVQPHIFEPFFTTKPAGKGTGLGLSSVYGIIKQHKGSITVSSSVGTGATFVVRFPAI